jgi:hypothetical protein
LESRAIWEEDCVLWDGDEALAEGRTVNAVEGDVIDEDRRVSGGIWEGIKEFEEESEET